MTLSTLEFEVYSFWLQWHFKIRGKKMFQGYVKCLQNGASSTLWYILSEVKHCQKKVCLYSFILQNVFLSAYRGFRLCMHRNISPENKRPPNLLMNTHKCNKHQTMFLLLKAISLFYAHQNNNARFHMATAMLGHKYSPFIISNGIFQLSISWITSQQRWQTKFGEGIQMM